MFRWRSTRMTQLDVRGKNEMNSDIQNLPTSLKVVLWTNIILGSFGVISNLLSIAHDPAGSTLNIFLTVSFIALVIFGILSRSMILKGIVMVLCGVALGIVGALVILVIWGNGLVGLLTAPAIIIALGFLPTVTIIGFSTSEAKQYFDIDKIRKENFKKLQKILSLGMSIKDAVSSVRINLEVLGPVRYSTDPSGERQQIELDTESTLIVLYSQDDRLIGWVVH